MLRTWYGKAENWHTNLVNTFHTPFPLQQPLVQVIDGLLPGQSDFLSGFPFFYSNILQCSLFSTEQPLKNLLETYYKAIKYIDACS